MCLLLLRFINFDLYHVLIRRWIRAVVHTMDQSLIQVEQEGPFLARIATFGGKMFR